MNKLIFLLLLIPIFFPIILATENCTTNWTCTDWSDCVGDKQIRSCIDIEHCNDVSLKPAEEKACGTFCTPDWDCGDWEPSICPETEVQNRNCTDLKKCNKIDGKPAETKMCVFEKKPTILYNVLIVTIILAIIVTIIFLIWIKAKKMKFQISQPL